MSKATDRRVQKLLIVAGLVLAVATPSMAATVTNLDDTVQTLIITEGGQQIQLPVGPGESIEICPSGCFVTLPNGDREVLVGTERLEIKASRGRIF